MSFLTKIFGSSNQRALKKMQILVDQINSLEAEYSILNDEVFASLRGNLKLSYADDTQQLLPHAFAATREASMRATGLRHFDSQMLGGISLAEGNIAEMKTGEGKTLVATLPAYLNAIQDKKVILVTVNDYLAQRDAEWMRPVYEFLGLTVGVIHSNQNMDEKKAAYKCDIIYATNGELGFDYLRDNMALRDEDKAQCSLDFAIIDEVDSILIDEARTPLIISGPSNESADYYLQIKKIIPKLKQQLREGTEDEPLLDEEIGHYMIDEKSRSVELTDEGYVEVENYLEGLGLLQSEDSLYSVSNIKIMRYVNATLKAAYLFKKNVHYLVRNQEVLLIDEHTGRTMSGRRMSEGIHQALECKENVAIQRESQTLASTTYQNFFRLFKQLSGMTGTADTEAAEFAEIYGLNVSIIPTNKPMARMDNEDLVFLTKEAKFKALIEEIELLQAKDAPILVGTASVESSEIVSELLTSKKIAHQVLNAKQHEREAEIIANAGRSGVVTIATNMAGRGTDIVLGGKQSEGDTEWVQRHQKVLDAGGLHILGTERHESRRIDNQLRGRSGRQGDPGYSKFFLSLEDDLLRLFISDSRRALFERIGMGDDHIEHKMLSRGIENAQKRIESRNFDIRKNLLEYDDVANDQRQAIYSLRNQLLEEDNISEAISELIQEEMLAVSRDFIPLESVESQWRVEELEKHLRDHYLIEENIKEAIAQNTKLTPDLIGELIAGQAAKRYTEKYQKIEKNIAQLEKQVMLQVLDVHWKDHLAEMDHLRQSVGLRAYAQKNPKNEYKREAFEMFETMLDEINTEAIKILFRLELASEEELKELEQRSVDAQNHKEMQLQQAQPELVVGNNGGLSAKTASNQETILRVEPKLGRNDPCHCGSGKKYKQCHGKA
ncbi:preprotein translocase subunit SecA [Gammaproteobacteria bacterium]|nr:preprotein translocase subunit SecA [Gammaproteobacteria bacterium]MDA9371117.1 preprotein translocase subunit SecA [Gammaproteobacteria bacterium]MDB9896361.1 preprotein translocase subunit SecA [Gammaproteobacteria bacterium]MDC0014824.1 preprotein translocase subunit SecA [Gammaproteobacteria bacterium]MDC0091893.1 preprotein translocase subunit SecA [Gammaproteobacteria bacterium]